MILLIFLREYIRTWSFCAANDVGFQEHRIGMTGNLFAEKAEESFYILLKVIHVIGEILLTQ